MSVHKKQEKPKYNDVPRFPLINQYEDSAKKAYQDTVVDMVKMLGTHMLNMVNK